LVTLTRKRKKFTVTVSYLHHQNKVALKCIRKTLVLAVEVVIQEIIELIIRLRIHKLEMTIKLQEREA